MKKCLGALALFFAAIFTPAYAQLSGWGYLSSFPWMYLNDEESWSYLFVVDDTYWAYVQETGEYMNLGEVTPGGDAPSSVVGAVFTLKVLDDGESGTAIMTFTSETDLHVLVEFPDESFEATGTYTYQRQGSFTGLLVIEIEDEEDQVDSLFSLIFDSESEGYYLSLSSDEEELPEAGEDGQYGDFSVVYTTFE